MSFPFVSPFSKVVTAAADTATFDVIDETLRLTNLCGLKEGDAVNFER